MENLNKSWVAVYADNTAIRQRDEAGNDVHSYHDIDQKQKQVKMFLIASDKGQTEMIVMVPDGWRLIYRARTFMRSDGSQNRVWLAGAQARDKSGRQFLSALYDDGRVVALDRFNSSVPELAPPVLAVDRGEEWDFLEA